MTGSKFGFTVEYLEADPDYEGTTSGWRVYLPHQCDRWDIDDEWGRYPSTQEDALEALDRFINEANAARAALARGEQYGEAS